MVASQLTRFTKNIEFTVGKSRWSILSWEDVFWISKTKQNTPFKSLFLFQVNFFKSIKYRNWVSFQTSDFLMGSMIKISLFSQKGRVPQGLISTTAWDSFWTNIMVNQRTQQTTDYYEIFLWRVIPQENEYSRLLNYIATILFWLKFQNKYLAMSKLNYFRIFSPLNISVVSIAHYDSELKENLNYGIFTGWRFHNLISLRWKFWVWENNERSRYVIKIQNHSNDSENTC